MKRLSAGFLLWMTTWFAATIISAVYLIRIGGWFPIFTAILLIFYYFAGGVITLFTAAVAIDSKEKYMKLKQQKEERT